MVTQCPPVMIVMSNTLQEFIFDRSV